MRVLIVLLVLVASPALGQARAPAEIVRSAVEEVIQPGFAALDAAAGAMTNAMDALCPAGSAAHLAAARAGFAELVEAWSRVEFFRFGPLAEDNRSERMLFWPDRRSIGLKQVQALLAEADETATDPQTLAGKSVAVQGLGALEFVLFGTGADQLATDPGYRCRYGRAIAQRIANLSAAMLAEWREPGGIADRMIAPSAQDPAYRSEREVMEELVGTLFHGMEAIRDTRILPFLGREADEAPKPRLAPFWRSDLTLRALAANLDGLRRLFAGSGIPAAVADPGEARYVEDAIDFEFRNADRALALVSAPIDEVLADAEARKALHYLVIVTGSLDELLGQRLAADLGLTVGFSSLDGD